MGTPKRHEFLPFGVPIMRNILYWVLILGLPFKETTKSLRGMRCTKATIPSWTTCRSDMPSDSGVSENWSSIIYRGRYHPPNNSQIALGPHKYTIFGDPRMQPRSPKRVFLERTNLKIVMLMWEFPEVRCSLSCLGNPKL